MGVAVGRATSSKAQATQEAKASPDVIALIRAAMVDVSRAGCVQLSLPCPTAEPVSTTSADAMAPLIMTARICPHESRDSSHSTIRRAKADSIEYAVG